MTSLEMASYVCLLQVSKVYENMAVGKKQENGIFYKKGVSVRGEKWCDCNVYLQLPLQKA